MLVDLQQALVFQPNMAFDPRNQYVWLNPDVLQWTAFSGGGRELDKEVRSRAHEIWGHADQVLGVATSDLQLVDVITTLKRSVDQRIRALDETYSLKSIPIKGKPSDVLSLLESIDVVRPLMFRNLREIRNAVEHEDAPPPDIQSSQVFLDFAWYFLKSTDRMLQVVPNQISFYPVDDNEDTYWMEFEYGPDQGWNPKLRGWLRPNLVSTQPASDWIVVACTRIESFGELKQRLTKSGDKVMLKHHEQRQNPDDWYFQGVVRGPSESILSLTRIYFAAG